MSLDLRSLYPNLYKETTRHPSSSPRPTSSKGTGRRKKQELDPPHLPVKSRTNSQRLPRAAQSINISKHQRLPPTITSDNQPVPRSDPSEPRTMPPLFVSSYSSRLSTPSVVASATLSPRTREAARELSFLGTQPVNVQQSQNPEEAISCKNALVLGKARAHVLRGELAVEATSTRAKRVPSQTASRSPAPLLHAASVASFPIAQPLQDLVQCSARPRSRYARREIASPMQPLPHRLSVSASSPALSTVSINDALESRPCSSSSIVSERHPMRGSEPTTVSDVGCCAPLVKPPMLSWTEQDASSFFLTEIDAKDVADQWAIAKALARGAHLLYAKREYERAVACFADALSLLQRQQQHLPQQEAPATPLMALLHHHMGVAFTEDGHSKWALMMQKKALEIAQQCGDLKLQARALKALGVLFLDRNEPQKALDCQQQAMKMALETGDAELEARVYANLGNLAAAQSQYRHAIACHERDLVTCGPSQLDSAVGQARAYRNLALVHAKLDNKKDVQLNHELEAARLEAANPFETDMRRHANDVVGNIYLQLSSPDTTLADMVATSVKDVLRAREDEDDCNDQKQLRGEESSPETCIT